MIILVMTMMMMVVMGDIKALGKLGNNVAETLFPTNVSPCFQEWANTRKH